LLTAVESRGAGRSKLVALGEQNPPGSCDGDLFSWRDVDGVWRPKGGSFRRGHVGAYLDEMSPELQELFWAQPENAAAMRMLN
jgi:hypothetical protein